MSLEASISFFIAIFIFGITPGPGTFVLLAKALNSELKDCIPLSLGMTISDIIYLLLATFGLAVIAENYSGLFLVIRIIGAAYLIFLGVRIWTAEIATLETHKKDKLSSKNWIKSCIQGFFISASNPKVILFYMAFLPTFMDLTALNTNDILLVITLTFFALMIGLLSVSFGASAIRQYLQSKKAIQLLNKVAGCIMIAAGIFLLSRGSNS